MTLGGVSKALELLVVPGSALHGPPGLQQLGGKIMRQVAHFSRWVSPTH